MIDPVVVQFRADMAMEHAKSADSKLEHALDLLSRIDAMDPMAQPAARSVVRIVLEGARHDLARLERMRRAGDEP